MREMSASCFDANDAPFVCLSVCINVFLLFHALSLSLFISPSLTFTRRQVYKCINLIFLLIPFFQLFFLTSSFLPSFQIITTFPPFLSLSLSSSIHKYHRFYSSLFPFLPSHILNISQSQSPSIFFFSFLSFQWPIMLLNPAAVSSMIITNSSSLSLSLCVCRCHFFFLYFSLSQYFFL